MINRAKKPFLTPCLTSALLWVALASEFRYLISVSLSFISAGNVLLALWTVDQNQLSDIITLVAKCSLEIQEKFGIYHTREGQDLQLKIGISY